MSRKPNLVNEIEPFVAHHADVAFCPCGCGAIGLLLCDEHNIVHAVASYTVEQWREIIPLMEDMVNGEIRPQPNS